MNLDVLKQQNLERWRAAKVTRDCSLVAKRLIAKKIRYQGVAAQTGVPWFVIAVIHERESSQDFACSLAQGDPWNKVSVHVPRGRGPFSNWEAAAVDALALCPPYAARWKDWSPAGVLTLLEQYNGLGYAKRGGIPSPYVWAGTDQYVSGKYIADGVFDPKAVDRQFGCAALILTMMQLDKTIKFNGENSIMPILPPPEVARRVRLTHPRPSYVDRFERAAKAAEKEDK